eukprot:m.165627 g.165627  ORF g.165627 m.165627 type:complete len:312 (-) comp17740_c0_seq7:58-993(-)
MSRGPVPVTATLTTTAYLSTVLAWALLLLETTSSRVAHRRGTSPTTMSACASTFLPLAQATRPTSAVWTGLPTQRCWQAAAATAWPTCATYASSGAQLPRKQSLLSSRRRCQRRVPLARAVCSPHRRRRHLPPHPRLRCCMCSGNRPGRQCCVPSGVPGSDRCSLQQAATATIRCGFGTDALERALAVRTLAQRSRDSFGTSPTAKWPSRLRAHYHSWRPGDTLCLPRPRSCPICPQGLSGSPKAQTDPRLFALSATKPSSSGVALTRKKGARGLRCCSFTLHRVSKEQQGPKSTARNSWVFVVSTTHTNT